MASLFAKLRAARPFFVMAGPNVIESHSHCMRMARALKVCKRHLIARNPR
jgi:3-deoxy-D-manno-octulosonic acid (KDO) 8-phosphate synthase